MFIWLVAGMLAASVAFMPVGAQIRDVSVPGHLEPTRNPGCITVSQADPELTPPDLGLGVLECAEQGQFALAFDLYILMQLRMIYDTRRVADPTAHSANNVLSRDVAIAMSSAGWTQMDAAAVEFGGSGSPQHQAFCRLMYAAGPPTYAPDYMILHGMRAVAQEMGQEDDRPSLVPDFDPDVAWAEVLSGYMECG